MKSLVLLSLLVLCTACGPAAVTFPTPIATQTSRPASLPTSTHVPTPTGTPTRLAPSPIPMFEGIIDSMAIDPQGTLFAGGYGASWDGSRHLAHWDGTKWIALEPPFEAGSSSLVTDSAGQLYTDGLTDFGQGMATVMMRWDGAQWEDISGNFSSVVDALKAGRISSNIPVAGLAVDGEDHLYAAGSYQYPSADHTAEWPMGYVARWDGDRWTVLGQGFDQVHIYGLAVSAAGQIYASGEQPRVTAGEYSMAGFIAEWDGERWTPIGTSELDPCFNIRNLALDKAGGLYASCTWNEGGELLFHWDGTDWTTITDQLQGEAPALYDLAADEDGHLYIGGSFDSVEGIPARNIASWDGSSWHALGEGIDGQVYALAFDPGGELYASGILSGAGGLPTGYVARWDGQSWHAPGP